MYKKTFKYKVVFLLPAISALWFSLVGVVIVACQQHSSSNPAQQKSANVNASSNTNNTKVTAAKDMVFVAAGPFILGSNKLDESGKQAEYGLVNPLYVNEHPRQTQKLQGFFIDKFEVTNGQYKAFVDATHHKEPFAWSQNGFNLVAQRLRATDLETLRWIATEYFKLDQNVTAMSKAQLLESMSRDQQIKSTLPVTGVSWFDAKQYCQWAQKRLPTEYEWEKAARGTEGLEYPWGNQWDPDITNTGDNSDWPDGIAPVGSYPKNISPYGAYDMSGNVWEWVDAWYKPYPGSTVHDDDFGEKKRVVRGGGGGIGHYALSVFYRGAARTAADPVTTSNDIGFRCALSVKSE